MKFNEKNSQSLRHNREFRQQSRKFIASSNIRGVVCAPIPREYYIHVSLSLFLSLSIVVEKLASCWLHAAETRVKLVLIYIHVYMRLNEKRRARELF